MLKTEEILGAEITKMNNQNLGKLKKIVEEGKVSWILGAGVSGAVGVPLWRTCLQRMWNRMLLISGKPDMEYMEGREFRETLKKIAENNKDSAKMREKISGIISGKKDCDVLENMDPLEAAEYIQNLVKEAIYTSEEKKHYWEIAFLCLVRECLQTGKSREKLSVDIKEQVLGILADHIKMQVDNAGMVNVITYNFDNLLEFALERAGMKKEKCHIKNPGTPNRIGEDKGVHIYHPHGTVSIVSDMISEESSRLVLAQSNYERLEEKVYIWENSIQAQVLHDSSCVFLGFSGDDYNFRRIIRNIESVEEGAGIEHYFFISIESTVKKMFESAIEKEILGSTARTEEERKQAIDKVKKDKEEYDKKLRKVFYSDEYHVERMMLIKRLYAQYLYWRHYNIVPIWTTRDELPKMVSAITNK